MLRDHWRTTKHEHAIVGYADRMDSLQAAILHARLSSADADNEVRRGLAARYSAELAGVGDLTLLADPAGRPSVFHHYVIQSAHRDALRKHLNANGVAAGVHYPLPLHLQPAYAGLGYQRGDLPETEAFADKCLSLPIYPELTSEQLDRVVAQVQAYFA